jgi:hypothetical protein
MRSLDFSIDRILPAALFSKWEQQEREREREREKNKVQVNFERQGCVTGLSVRLGRSCEE